MKQSIFGLFATLLLASFSFAQTSQNIRIVSYNLLNFPDGRNDCGGTNVNLPNRTDTLRKIMGYLQPDILVGCEIQSEEGCDSILTRSLNVFGETGFMRADYIPNQSSSNDLQNMLFYDSQKLVLLEQNVIQTAVRDINHYVLYVIDPNLNQHLDTCFIEVYMCHLKAGSAASDLDERAQQTALLRAYIDGRPAKRHHFVCGDLNTYRSNEVGYQNLVSGGGSPLRDPINAPGNWTNNGTFDYLHTQSPRSSGSIDCGVTGGLDDRFDHILVSQNVMNGSDSLKFVPNSYRAIGNDGNHFNSNLLTGGNTMYPDSVVRALYYASDHLPVAADFQYTFPTNFGLAIDYSVSSVSCQNATATATISPNLGTAPFSYQWSGSAAGQTGNTASNLPSGNYCVTVTDATGIEDEVCFQIPPITVLGGSVFSSAENTDCDGSAFIIVSGGQAPYTFEWNDPANQTTENAVNLCAGDYSCLVTDANGCSFSFSVTIQGATASVEEIFATANFIVAPNPVIDLLSVYNVSSETLRDVQIRLLNVTGQVLVTQFVNTWNAKDEILIPMSELPAGSYLLELSVPKAQKIMRIMK